MSPCLVRQVCWSNLSLAVFFSHPECLDDLEAYTSTPGRGTLARTFDWTCFSSLSHMSGDDGPRTFFTKGLELASQARTNPWKSAQESPRRLLICER